MRPICGDKAGLTNICTLAPNQSTQPEGDTHWYLRLLCFFSLPELAFVVCELPARSLIRVSLDFPFWHKNEVKKQNPEHVKCSNGIYTHLALFLTNTLIILKCSHGMFVCKSKEISNLVSKLFSSFYPFGLKEFFLNPYFFSLSLAGLWLDGCRGRSRALQAQQLHSRTMQLKRNMLLGLCRRNVLSAATMNGTLSRRWLWVVLKMPMSLPSLWKWK